MAAFGAPLSWLAPGLAAAAFIATGWALRTGRELAGLVASGAAMVGMVAILGIGLYPALGPGLGDPSRSLTISGTAASDLTLTVMLAVALVGVPLVLVYPAFVYWRFRGKVEAGEGGY